METGAVIALIALGVLVVLLIGGALVVTGRKPEFVGHPKGLYVLFFAEMWERFSYYGMRALLIFYLTMHWLFSDGDATLIYGAYTSLVYITPVLGGYLADRYLGQRKAVVFGAVLIAIGHVLMTIEGDGGQSDPAINAFWAALAFIIVGTGFLKANISVIVGQLYPRTDVRRDGAYTIFYMGINVGAAVGTILVGYLGTHPDYGWSYGFGLAAIGMILGLVVLVVFKPLLMGKGEPPEPAALKRPAFGVNLEWFLYILGVASVAVIWVLIQYQDVVGSLLLLSGAVLLLYVLAAGIYTLPYGSIGKAPRGSLATFGLASILLILGCVMLILDPLAGNTAAIIGGVGILLLLGVMVQQAMTREDHARDRLYAIIFLLLLQPVFWGLFEQAGGSLNLFTDRHVDIGGVPAPLLQSINPIYIILLGPIFAWLWTTLGRKGLEPSTPAKFGLGIVQVGFGFLVLFWGAQAVGLGVAVPVIFVFLLYLFHTTGELCLSPVGLSAMNRLSPRHMASLIMGAWFFATAGGNFVAGMIGRATGGEDGDASRESVLAVYNTIGWWAVGIGVVVLLVSPLVTRLVHRESLRDDDVGDDLEGQAEGVMPASAGMHPTTDPDRRGSEDERR